MHPKGTCSASLHCVGIAPYGEAQGVFADNADNIGNQHKPTDRKDGYIDAENYAG